MKTLAFAVLALVLSAGAAAPEFDPALLRNGDILFQTSRSGQSLPIQIATRSRWSHCGIVYIQDGKPMVYEASGKVKLTPLKRFIRKGEGGRFEVKRLAAADSLLTPENLVRLKAAGKVFDGRPYDSFFGWADGHIYCSELVYKMYRNALGLEIGVTRKLREFDLENPVVASALAVRYGKSIPLEEPVIAPSDMYLDPRLVTVYSNFETPAQTGQPIP